MQQISTHVYCDEFISGLALETRLMPNHYNDYPYLIIKNFLSRPLCSEIAEHASTASDDAEEARLRGSYDANVNKKIRKTIQHTFPDVFQSAYDISFRKHQSSMEEFFNIALTTSTKVQALEYTKGSFYIKHADDSSELLDEEGNTIGFKQVAAQRKLSTVLFTTSHACHGTKGKTFKGGELLFNYLFDAEGKPISLRPEAGDMIIFPSNPIYSHEVLPVEEGYRLTLVQWHDAI